MSDAQIDADPRRIGVDKSEVFKTIAALVPTIMYQEKKSVNDAADKALAVVLACIRRTELAFMPEAERLQRMDREPAPMRPAPSQQSAPVMNQDRQMSDDYAREAAKQQVLRQTDRR